MINKKMDLKCEEFGRVTIKDNLIEPMMTLKEVSEEIGFKVDLNKKFYKYDEDTYVQTILTKTKNATWISFECFDKGDYEYITIDYVNELKEDYKSYLEEYNWDLEYNKENNIEIISWEDFFKSRY